jgi:hypothetical protein
LDAGEDVEVVDSPTLDEALAMAGARAGLGVLAVGVPADVGLAEFVEVGPDLLATMGATVEMPLICMIECLLCSRRSLQTRVSAGSSKPLVRLLAGAVKMAGATVRVLDIDAVPKRGPQNLAVCLDEYLARSIANQKPAESSSGMIQLHKARATAAKDQ